MSPELETLDQLLGGPLPLISLRSLFADEKAFARGLMGLLANGDIRLVDEAGGEIPAHRWRELTGGWRTSLAGTRGELTAGGAKRIG